jgi:AhpD family alkylhydroperoxidase
METSHTKPRLNYKKAAPGLYAGMDAVDQYLTDCELEESLLHLIRLRASQINGCAYCIDMHWKDLRALGEAEQRLSCLSAWRDASFYSARERAALAWTESVTRVSVDRVPDSLFAEVREHFSEKELCDLTLAVAAINSWNRLSIAARLTPGSYQPAAAAAVAALSP